MPTPPWPLMPLLVLILKRWKPRSHADEVAGSVTVTRERSSRLMWSQDSSLVASTRVVKVPSPLSVWVSRSVAALLAAALEWPPSVLASLSEPISSAQAIDARSAAAARGQKKGEVRVRMVGSSLSQ